ncbi:MAG: zinc metallopeptidase [Rikenellaceae bacterium]|jgi:Zn-dependent membrane protease YugP|nr:zinc metallopeptidase [Rikenellaceae bacterium]
MAPEFMLIILVAVAGFIVQARLQSVFAKYSKVPFPGGLTGREVAEKMLRDNGITDVRVTATRGNLTDNFNPATRTVNLSEPVYATPSISAAAVAAHECGHAVQHARGYAPLRMRSALVPVVSFSSQISTWVVIAGILLIGTFPALFWIGIGLMGMALLFSLITLPVEINASRRALAWLDSTAMLDDQQYRQARQALSWAAGTYVIAALSALTSIIYYIGLAGRRN